MSFYVLFYLSLLLFLILFEVKRFKHTQVDAMTFFNVFFVMKYLLPAVLWAWFPEHNLWKNYDLQYNAATQPFVLFTLGFTYITVVLSFYMFLRVKDGYLLSVKFTSSLSEFCKFQVLFSLFIILLICIAIYLEGGVTTYIQKGLSTRYFSSGGGFSQYIKYFLYPTSIWFIAILAIYLHSSHRNKYLILFLTLAFFVFMMIFILSLGGRAAIIYVFLNFFLFIFVCNDKIKISHLFIVAFSVAIVILIMNYFREITFIFLSDGEVNLDSVEEKESGWVDSLLGVFSYYQHYFFTINESINTENIYEYPRLGLDSLRAFISLVPGVGSSDNLDVFGLTSNVSEINKSVIGGYTGYIPPGWIGMALLDGGLIWLLLKSIVIGTTAAFINKSFINFDRTCSISMYFYFLIIILWNHFLFLQEPFSIAQQSLGYYFYILLLLPFVRIILVKK